MNTSVERGTSPNVPNVMRLAPPPLDFPVRDQPGPVGVEHSGRDELIHICKSCPGEGYAHGPTCVTYCGKCLNGVIVVSWDEVIVDGLECVVCHVMHKEEP